MIFIPVKINTINIKEHAVACELKQEDPLNAEEIIYEHTVQNRDRTVSGGTIGTKINRDN